MLGHFKLVSFLTCLLAISSASAAWRPSHYFVSVLYGQVGGYQLPAQSVELYNIEGHSFSGQFSSVKTNASSELGLEGGFVTPLNPFLALNWTLGLYQIGEQTGTGNYYFNGDETPDSHYQYALRSQRIVPSVMLQYAPWQASTQKMLSHIAFFVRLGLGYGQLTTHYSADRVSELDAPQFANSTHAGLTNEYGIGLRYAFTQHWQAQLGYDWLNLGKTGALASNQTGQRADAALSGMTLNTTQLAVRMIYQF